MSARPAQAFRLSGVTPRRSNLILAAFMAGTGVAVDGRRPIAVAAAAADPAVGAGAWLAEEVRGTVLVRAAGEAAASWQPLQAATPIAGQSEIATGSDGVAVLDNGVDQIRLTPNSRLVLPADQDAGLMTVIRQSLGKIFFDIGPRPDRSFEVDAPYLVVLVKGTKFTVSANYLGDSVAVTEGTVEVRAAAGGDGSGNADRGRADRQRRRRRQLDRSRVRRTIGAMARARARAEANRSRTCRRHERPSRRVAVVARMGGEGGR